MPSIFGQEHDRSLVMGVVNVTPDSFSDGGRFFDPQVAIEAGLRMRDEGADLIDVGGESTRPGAAPVSSQQELDRVAPVIERLAHEIEIPLSVDTSKPEVARECLRLGARVVNDVTGFELEEMRRLTAEAGAAAVIMHMRGRPQTMQRDTYYEDLIGEVRDFLAERAWLTAEAGVAEIAVDPGLGFGKSAAQNFVLLRRLREFSSLGRPLLVGPSRKSFLGSLRSRLPRDQRLEGTIAAVCVAVVEGAKIVRVHDVAAVKRAVEVVDAVRIA